MKDTVPQKMKTPALVLSDELLKCYYDFKNGKVHDSDLLEKFLSYYHAPHKTTVEQLDRIGYDDSRLKQQLMRSESLPLEELAQKTLYKIILNTEKSEYPYVNINDDPVEKNFSLTFRIGENRDKLIQMIKAFCQDANTILIFDKYLSLKNNQERTIQFFKELMPCKNLTFFYDREHLTQEIKTEIKKICKEWRLIEDRKSGLKNSHDRYIIIDNQIEIILSGGFSNLFDIRSDISCLIRE